jgi:hypothetical protein
MSRRGRGQTFRLPKRGPRSNHAIDLREPNSGFMPDYARPKSLQPLKAWRLNRTGVKYVLTYYFPPKTNIAQAVGNDAASSRQTQPFSSRLESVPLSH